jgi:hypothetical protein
MVHEKFFFLLPAKETWIGLHDPDGTRAWRWVSTNATATYTGWRRGEPNNYGGNENCVHTLANGYWNDAPCDTFMHTVVCETDYL